MNCIPKKELEEILSAVPFYVQVYVKDCQSEDEFSFRADEQVQAASTIKVPVLALLLKDAQDGKVDLDEPRVFPDSNRAGGSGLLYYLSKTYQPTLRDLALLMITVSDNAATNELIDVVGMDRFNRFWKEWGCRHTVLMRKMMDLQALREGKNNYTSAADAGKILTAVAGGKLFNPEISAEMINIMRKQKMRNRLPLLLPCADGYNSEGDVPANKVLVANKTGSLVGMNHDVGIFELPGHRRYVMAVYTKGFKEEAQAVMLIARLSETVYKGMR